MVQIQNYINGTYTNAVSNTWIDNYNPATGKVYSQIADSDDKDVEAAYQSANAAYGNWKTTPHEERFILLNRIAELIDKNNDALAEAESIDQGKPKWLAKNEIKRAAQNLDFLRLQLCSFRTKVTITKAILLTIHCANPLVWLVVSVLGIYLCICSLGK